MDNEISHHNFFWIQNILESSCDYLPLLHQSTITCTTRVCPIMWKKNWNLLFISFRNLDKKKFFWRPTSVLFSDSQSSLMTSFHLWTNTGREHHKQLLLIVCDKNISIWSHCFKLDKTNFTSLFSCFFFKAFFFISSFFSMLFCHSVCREREKKEWTLIEVHSDSL